MIQARRRRHDASVQVWHQRRLRMDGQIKWTIIALDPHLPIGV
jgi:hypothetical protein